MEKTLSNFNRTAKRRILFVFFSHGLKGAQQVISNFNKRADSETKKILSYISDRAKRVRKIPSIFFKEWKARKNNLISMKERITLKSLTIISYNAESAETSVYFELESGAARTNFAFYGVNISSVCNLQSAIHTLNSSSI